MAVTDLTGYTWVGNNVINIEHIIGFGRVYLDFINNGIEYNQIIAGNEEQVPDIEFPEDYDYCMIYINEYGEYLPVYFFNSDTYAGYWVNNLYKAMQITGGDDVTSGDLIAWLEANGTLTAPSAKQGIKLGDTNISAIKLGETDIVKVYQGSNLIWEKSQPQPTGETWVMYENNLYVPTNDIDLNINFISNNTSYNRLSIKMEMSPMGNDLIIRYNTLAVYSQYSFSYPEYRIITFETPPTGDLLTWLQANGIKQ